MYDIDDEEDLVISTSQAVHSNPDPRLPVQQPHSGSDRSLATAFRNGHSPDAPPLASPHATTEQHKPGKDISDPIFPDLHLPANVMQYVDTPIFQRLRNLKQLGCTQYVYAGATHTRFEHSLGVAYLAFQWGYRVLNNFSRECDVENRDVLLLMLAGACHDLGHGPFSHMFETCVLPSAGVTGWRHEDMSCRLLEAIVDQHHIDLPRDEIRRVQQLINCPKDGPPPQEQKKWMFEVVSNWRNSLDVDKLDYLCRDSYYCSVPNPIELGRLQNNFRVIGDEICYEEGMYRRLYKVYDHRADMHRTVYQHRKVRAIEHMVADALLAANRSLHFTDHVKSDDISGYAGLDDSVLQSIKHYGLLVPDYNKREECQGVVEAQRIIRQLENRQLYRFVCESLVPWEDIERGQWQAPDAATLAAMCSHGGIQLRPEDIIVSESRVNFAMQDKNPLANIHFYQANEDKLKRSIRTYDVTHMSIEKFQEVKLRVYSRRTDRDYTEALLRASERWHNSRFGGRVSLATPLKSGRAAIIADVPPSPDRSSFTIASGSTNINGNGCEPLARKRARGLFNGNSLTPVTETL